MFDKIHIFSMKYSTILHRPIFPPPLFSRGGGPSDASTDAQRIRMLLGGWRWCSKMGWFILVLTILIYYEIMVYMDIIYKWAMFNSKLLVYWRDLKGIYI
jgi:hypothetical protein